MKNFLLYTLATITGIVVASFLFFFIMIGSLGVMMASGDKPVSIDDNSILILKSGVQVPDRGDSNPLAGFDILNMSFSTAPGLNDILSSLEKAATDPKIKGVLIEHGLLPAGWATAREIRLALDEFKTKSGKFVISYSDYVMPQEGYYLSSIADKSYINPASSVDFKGLSGEVMFYKNALEKLGVDVQVIRHGKFKGAVEPYILDKLSDENKAQIKDYVGSIWENVLADISVSRGLSVERLNQIADSLGGNIAADALANKLVDGLIYRDQLIDSLKILSGLTTDDKISLVPLTRYTRVAAHTKTTTGKNRISVIYASGSIVNGKGTEYNIGGNNYADILRKERKDSNVKAIVLRVNSPGGSATASDLIWRELVLAAESKPVIISMGNYAASGGYYISAPGSIVFASPTTITGSIGVFGLIPNVGKLMDEKLGITTETVNTNKYSEFPSLFRPMSTYENAMMQRNIETIYSEFISKVSDGRGMTTANVDSIGQGRVWSGASAIGIGLVDTIGGLKDAIAYAKKLAGEDCSVRELPVIEDPYVKLLNQLSGEIRMGMLKSELGPFFKYYRELTEIKTLEGIQARLPYFIDIR